MPHLKILVVDDSLAIRERLVEMLSALEGVYRVDTAARASTAWEAILADPPDIVLLDIHMPGGSGLAVLNSLQTRMPDVVTIVLTNDPSAQWREASLGAGAGFFFDKFYDFERAVDVVARLAAGR